MVAKMCGHTHVRSTYQNARTSARAPWVDVRPEPTGLETGQRLERRATVRREAGQGQKPSLPPPPQLTVKFSERMTTAVWGARGWWGRGAEGGGKGWGGGGRRIGGSGGDGFGRRTPRSARPPPPHLRIFLVRVQMVPLLPLLSTNPHHPLPLQRLPLLFSFVLVQLSCVVESLASDIACPRLLLHELLHLGLK